MVDNLASVHALESKFQGEIVRWYNLVPRPCSTRGLVTHLTLPCPRGIQSFMQSRANVYVSSDKLKLCAAAWLE